MKVFKQALFAKQATRLCRDEGSILHDHLKVRYFKNPTFLKARRGYDPSFSWRSIWGQKINVVGGANMTGWEWVQY